MANTLNNPEDLLPLNIPEPATLLSGYFLDGNVTHSTVSG